MALNVIMLGPPGAGKGTQAERFARDHDVPWIATGDMLREAVHAGTELGRLAKATMEAGRLVSDDLMIGIVGHRLERADARRGFVLDGFPRTVAQATALDRLMAGRDPLIIVDIVVPEEVLIRRLGGRRICGRCGTNASVDAGADTCNRCGGRLVQRRDDGITVVRERLAVYTRETKPLVDHYGRRPTFLAIDGSQPADRVGADIRAAVEAVVGQLEADTQERGRA